jgi:hypothetical protein
VAPRKRQPQPRRQRIGARATLGAVGVASGIWAAYSRDDWFLLIGSVLLLVAFADRMPILIEFGPRGGRIQWEPTLMRLARKSTPEDRELARQLAKVLDRVSAIPEEFARALRDVLHAYVEAPETTRIERPARIEELAAGFRASWVAASARAMEAAPGMFIQCACVYQNSGSAPWIKGQSDSEVRVVPVPPADSAFINSDWLPAFAGPYFARQTNDLVASGALGSFVWVMRIPLGTPAGTYYIRYQPTVGGVGVIGVGDYFVLRVAA